MDANYDTDLTTNMRVTDSVIFYGDIIEQLEPGGVPVQFYCRPESIPFVAGSLWVHFRMLKIGVYLEYESHILGFPWKHKPTGDVFTMNRDHHWDEGVPIEPPTPTSTPWPTHTFPPATPAPRAIIPE